MHRLLLALLLGACATTPASVRPDAERVEASPVVETPASAGSEVVEVVEAPSAPVEPVVTEPVTDEGPPPRAFFVERLAGEAFVLLGTTPPRAPRRVRPRLVGSEDDEVRLDVYPADFEPPLLTPVGETPCPSVRGEPVYVRRNLADPDIERHYGDPTLYAAVRIDAGCVPYAAIEGERPGARLVVFEFEDVEFGDPIVGRASGWEARIVYPPTTDGICPGFPAAITITRPRRAPASIEMWALASTVLAIEDGPHAWLLARSFTDYSLQPLGAPPVWNHYPTGVDLAEECL